MNVEKIIQQLLFENQAVTVPGLGTFSKEYKAASVDEKNGLLHPPGSKPSFDTRDGDGQLLASGLEKAYGFTQADCKAAIENYVAEINSELNSKGKYRFEGIGSLVSLPSGQKDFAPDLNSNFHFETFGLRPVKMPEPIERKSPETRTKVAHSVPPAVKKAAPVPVENKKSKIEKKPQAAKKTSPSEPVKKVKPEPKKAERKSVETPAARKAVASEEPKRRLSVGNVLLPLIVSLLLCTLIVQLLISDRPITELFSSKKADQEVVQKNENAAKYAETKAIDEGEQDETTAINAGEKAAEAATSEIEKAGIETPAKDAKESTPVKQATNLYGDPPSGYYIVTGAYGEAVNAEKAARKLQNSGYQAVIIGSGSRLKKVCVFGTSEKKKAQDLLQSLVDEGNQGAWLMKK